jgi:putative acyl-CoA dehydrogenase
MDSTMDKMIAAGTAQAALPDRFLATTHEVTNQPTELADYNVYAADRALREAVAREGARAAEAGLLEFGQRIGTAEYL